MADNNENKNVNTDEINNNTNPNVEADNAQQTNVADNEFAGLQEMFGDISLDNHNLTKEQQEYVMEQARKRAQDDARQQRGQLNPNFMFEQWNRQRMQNGGFGINPQTRPQGNIKVQGTTGGMKIPGMNYVPMPQPKAEEKKPPVSEQPKPEKPKNVYVSEKIPGMSNSTFDMKVADESRKPQMTQEELDAKFLKDAEAMLERLRKMGRSSDPDEKRARDRKSVV